MMASEMDLDEVDEEAMAIAADELGLKIGNKVDSLADEVRDAGNLLAGMVGRAVDVVGDTLRKPISFGVRKTRQAAAFGPSRSDSRRDYHAMRDLGPVSSTSSESIT